MNPFQAIEWTWIVLLVIWIAASLLSKSNVRRQPDSSRLQQSALGAVAALLIWGKFWKSPRMIPETPETGWVALAIVLAGVGLALWARFALGTNWSAAVAIKKDHELVREGPYRIVRHPIYTGFLVALLGTAVAHGTAGAFIGLALAAAMLRWKSLAEEEFMTERFGPRYAKYKRETRALIPFVW